MSSDAVESWTFEEVGEWLTRVGLGKFAELFIRHEITGDILLTMTEADVAAPPLSVQMFGPLRKFGMEIKKLRNSVLPTNGTSSPDHATATLQSEAPDATRAESAEVVRYMTETDRVTQMESRAENGGVVKTTTTHHVAKVDKSAAAAGECRVTKTEQTATKRAATNFSEERLTDECQKDTVEAKRKSIGGTSESLAQERLQEVKDVIKPTSNLKAMWEQKSNIPMPESPKSPVAATDDVVVRSVVKKAWPPMPSRESFEQPDDQRLSYENGSKLSSPVSPKAFSPTVKPTYRSRELITLAEGEQQPSVMSTVRVVAPVPQSSCGGFRHDKHQLPSSRLQSNAGAPAPYDKTTRTLEVSRIPVSFNTITKLNEHFAQFGHITNIQVRYDDDPEAALVTFASFPQAMAAYKSPILNNRFIRMFWHNKDANDDLSTDRPSVKDRLGPAPIDPVTPLDDTSMKARLIDPTEDAEGNRRSVFLTTSGGLTKTVYNPAALKSAAASVYKPNHPVTVPQAPAMEKHVHASKKQQVAKAKGSVYQWVNPGRDINTSERDKFWSMETILRDPQDNPLCKDWLNQFDLASKKVETCKIISSNRKMKNLYLKLVNAEDSYDDFWRRYFFNIYQLELAEKAQREFYKSTHKKDRGGMNTFRRNNVNSRGGGMSRPPLHHRPNGPFSRGGGGGGPGRTFNNRQPMGGGHVHAFAGSNSVQK